MRYTPKKLKGNVNISDKSPLKEFFKLLFGLLLIIIITYILLGVAVDILASRLPDSLENNLALLYESMYANNTVENEGSEKIKILLGELVQTLGSEKSYTLSVVKGPSVNAFALPGNHILVYSKLIKEVDSENELSYVLAHELGHFDSRDHLKALGRRLVMIAISNVIFGQENTLSKVIGDSLINTEMKFSQKQEQAADIFAIELLSKHYGNNLGAVSFLEKIEKKHTSPAFLSFFSTHPHPSKRIKIIKKKIGARLLNAKPSPLDDTIKHMFSKN